MREYHSHKLSIIDAKRFIFGGKAILTLLNTKTGKRVTWKVTQPKDKFDQPNSIFWVSVFYGTDNNAHWQFIGSIYNKTTFKHSYKSRLPHDIKEVLGFEYLMRALNSSTIPEHFEIWHEGRCCRCGRRLTVPSSIERGIGPECAGIKRSRIEKEELENENQQW